MQKLDMGPIFGGPYILEILGSWTWSQKLAANAKKCSLTNVCSCCKYDLTCTTRFYKCWGQTCQNQFIICTRSANEWHKTDYELQMSQYGYQHVTDISLSNVHSLFWSFVYNDIFELHVCDVMIHRKIILTVSFTTFGEFILLVMCACTINELHNMWPICTKPVTCRRKHKLSFSYVQKEEKMGFNLVQKTFICDN